MDYTTIIFTLLGQIMGLALLFMMAAGCLMWASGVSARLPRRMRKRLSKEELRKILKVKHGRQNEDPEPPWAA